MNFGEAIAVLKDGGKVQRGGWNGKGMFLIYVPADKWSTSVGPSNIPNAHRLPWIGLKTVDGELVPWLASQTDLLAEDWDTWTAA